MSTIRGDTTHLSRRLGLGQFYVPLEEIDFKPSQSSWEGDISVATKLHVVLIQNTYA